MEIDDRWLPLLLQATRDGMRYKELLLKSETLRNIEDHEENLMFMGELLGYLVDEYKKNQDRFKFTPEQILEGKD